MANHLLPTVTSNYTDVISQFKDRIDDIAKGLDVTATNVPENSIRWDSASNSWKKYTAAGGWATLAAFYNININGTVGATTASTGAFTTLSTSGVAALGANSTVGTVDIVGVSGAQTLTNKTLTSPKISTISNTGIITLPTTTTTLVGTDTTDTLTNKTLTTPKIASGGSINDTATTSLPMLSFGSVASAVNNLRITNSIATATPILEAIGSDTNIGLNLKSKGTGTVQANGVDIVTVSGTQTLTNKTLTSPTISSISNIGTVTLPTDTTTLIGRDTTDTLTNKTLTRPKIADGGSINDTATTSLAMLSFGTVTNAVNNLKVTNAATAGIPVLEAIGSDTNIGLNLKSKGTGTVQANGVNIVTVSSFQTLTNKILTEPSITAIRNVGSSEQGPTLSVITLPSSTTTLVGTDTTNTLTNKTISTGSSYQGSTVAVAYGGTGGTTAVLARAGLGLVIGTDIPSLTGAGASGTWDINISGNAANGGVTSVNGSTGAVTLVTGVSSVNGSTGAVTVTPKAPIVTDTFTSSGTWTKPTGGQTMAVIQLWGGGGAGGRSGYTNPGGGGGGGGGYSIVTIPLSALPATLGVTVGSGGLASTNPIGNIGGNSVFGVYAIAVGGNGGGNADLGYDVGGSGGQADGNFGRGATGGYGYSSATSNPIYGNPSSSINQGGGGGAGGHPSTVYVGGSSSTSGAGGAGGIGSNAGGDGTAPGGGGGGSCTGTSGSGGKGRVIVTCW